MKRNSQDFKVLTYLEENNGIKHKQNVFLFLNKNQQLCTDLRKKLSTQGYIIADKNVWQLTEKGYETLKPKKWWNRIKIEVISIIITIILSIIGWIFFT